MYKKLISLFIALIVILTMTSCGKKTTDTDVPADDTENTPVGYTDNIKGVFDDSNIVLTFPVFSDIHLEGGYAYESSYNRFVNAVNCVRNASVTKKLDLLCVAGDLVCCTNSKVNVYYGNQKYPGTREEQYALQSVKEKENLKRAIMDTIYPDTKFFYCTGNHDSIGGNYTKDFIAALSGENNKDFDYFYGDDLDKESLQSGYRYIKMGDSHFIAAECGITDEGYVWLKNTLDSIVSSDPTANIFMLYHYKPANMTFDSSNQDRQIRKFLESYPQVIVFGGHSHTYVNFENAIMQSNKGFISVDCGSVSELNEADLVKLNGGDALNAKGADIKKHSEGLLAEVDKGGNVRISRFDFILNEKVGNNWVIPAIKSDGSRELLYTKDREGSKDKPILTGNATVQYESGYIRLNIPKATSSQTIYRYEVTVSDESGEKVSSVNYVSSLFFTCATAEELPKKYNVRFKPDISITTGKYIASIVAVDSWGNTSDPLKVEFTA